MQKRQFQWIRAAILVYATVWIVSCSTDDNTDLKPTNESGAAYRAVLQGLDWGQDTTFVYGHKTPDVDAVCSSLSYAKLMRALGYNCKAKVSSPINRETQFIAQRFGFDVPELKTAVAVMPAVLSDNKRDMLFAKIDVLVPNPDQSDPDTPYVEDGLYFIYYGEGAQAVAEAIFGPSVRPGATYSKEHLSRKQIVPKIMEILQ